MKLLTVPIRLLFRLVALVVVIPIKVILATAGLTFRTGFKAGTLPVKASVAGGRALGLKALVLFAAGVALGVVVGRRLAAAGVELERPEPSFGARRADDGDAFSASRGNGAAVALVEDAIEVVETPDGTIVSETVVVTELEDAAARTGPASGTASAPSEADLEAEMEMEAVSEALGETGGDLGADADEPTGGR